MSEFDEQLDRIQSKLRRARAARSSPFGAASHGYKLRRPMRESEVVSFETEHGVLLPPAYRAFLREVGQGGPKNNGGAGPYYGLYGLDKWDDFLDWLNDGAPRDWLSRSCPLRPGRNALPEIAEDVPDDDWPGEELLANFAGILTIGTRGCTYMTGLIVTGAARGRVVYLDVDVHGEAPYVGRDLNFLDWYERWLDEQLAGYNGTWFGYGPAGDESCLVDLIEDTPDPELRLEAITNLWKLPALTGASWKTLVEVIAHGSDEQCAMAVRIFERGLPAHAPLFEPLLSHAAPSVRAAACRTFLNLDPSATDTVWSLLLAEHDHDVQRAAYFALEKHQALSAPRLEALVECEALGPVRETAARALAVAQS